jgi:hypothetical protein
MTHETPYKFSAKYPFIFDDVFLIAEVEKTSGKQWLVMQKVDPRTNMVLMEDRIQCIHTAITTIPADEFHEAVADETFTDGILYMRSSERAREIKLDIADKIFAFKSWVEGIAEAGLNAITIQEDIERFASLMTPIGKPIFNFLLRAKLEFIEEFLQQIARNSRYNGEYHKPSINANLMRLLKVIVLEEKEAWNQWRDQVRVAYDWDERWNLYVIKNFDKVMKQIFELQPSANIFLEEKKYNFMLTLPRAKILEDWYEVTDNSAMYDNKYFKCYEDEETGLLALDLSCQKIPTIGAIRFLDRVEGVKQLHLEVNYLERLEGLESFSGLKRLHVNHNYITKIENLEHFKELELLYMGFNPIEKIEGLDALENLKSLYLFDTKIQKLEGLETLRNLEVLCLSWCQIDEISGLEKLENLKSLNLGGNHITEVKNLENLANLETLELWSNKLTEQPDLSFLKNLKTLSLNDNPFGEV